MKIRGTPQSGHYIIGIFNLPTYSLLWKGRYHSTFGVRQSKILKFIVLMHTYSNYVVNISTYLILSMLTSYVGCMVGSL